MVTLFDSYSYDGVSAGIWVILQVPNLGVTLFDSHSSDGVNAGIWVIHTGNRFQIWVRAGHTFCPSLLNDCLRYDKLWGPSQRVVTLFFFHKHSDIHT